MPFKLHCYLQLSKVLLDLNCRSTKKGKFCIGTQQAEGGFDIDVVKEYWLLNFCKYNYGEDFKWPPDVLIFISTCRLLVLQARYIL